MRKSLLTLALLATGTACLNAQNVEFSVSESAQRQAVQKMNIEKCGMNAPLATMKNAGGSVLDNKGRIIRRAEGDVTAVYGFPVGGLFYGLSDDGYSFNAIRMVTGGFTDVTFKNYSNDGQSRVTDVTWSWPDGTPLTGTEKVSDEGDLTAQVFGSIQFPLLTAGASTYGGEFEGSRGMVKAYWEGGTQKIGTADFNTGTETLTKPISISNACVQFGTYSGFNNGGSFTSKENFLTIEDGAWKDTGKKLVGFAELYDKPLGLVYAKDVTFVVWGDGVKDANAPLNGQTLTTDIYTFGADGKLKPFTTVTATDDDVISVGNDMYIISFKFMEEDPILGSVEAPVILPEEDFFVVISGFEKVDASFIAPFAAANGDSGHGYALLEDGSLSTIPYRNSEDPQVNLHIGFHAAMPVAELGSPENGIAVAPVEGGYAVTATNGDNAYNDIDIYTLTEAAEWTIEYPDWIEAVECDESYLNRGILAFYIKAAALPADQSGRTGDVTFTLYGKQVKVTVTQGATDGISSVENNATAKDNVIYNISGQKVNDGYKGLVIKNGKKFINK